MPIQTLHGTFYGKDSAGNLSKLAINAPSEYVGATSSSAGSPGLVPAALSTEKNKFLRGDGNWVTTNVDLDLDVQIDETTVPSSIDYYTTEFSDGDPFNLRASIAVDGTYIVGTSTVTATIQQNLTSLDSFDVDCSAATNLSNSSEFDILISISHQPSGGDFWVHYSVTTTLQELLNTVDGIEMSEDTSEGGLFVNLASIGKSMHIRCVSAGNGVYTFYLGVFTPASTRRDVTADLILTNPDGTEDTVDMTPLLGAIDLSNYATTDVATTYSNGLMSFEDKIKLGELENYTHPIFTAQSAVPSGNQTPSFGSTFTVPSVSRDTQGHASIASKTVKIPDTVVSTSVKGLAPQITNASGYLKGDGTWSTVPVVKQLDSTFTDKVAMGVSYAKIHLRVNWWNSIDVSDLVDLDKVYPYLIPDVRTTLDTFTCTDQYISSSDHIFAIRVEDFSLDPGAMDGGSYNNYQRAFIDLQYDDLPSVVGESIKLVRDDSWAGATDPEIDDTSVDVWLRLVSIDSTNGTRTFAIDYLWTHDPSDYKLFLTAEAEIYCYYDSNSYEDYINFVRDNDNLVDAYSWLDFTTPNSNPIISLDQNSYISISIDSSLGGSRNGSVTGKLPWLDSNDEEVDPIIIDIYPEFNDIIDGETRTHIYNNNSGWAFKVEAEGVEYEDTNSNSPTYQQNIPGLRITKLSFASPTLTYADAHPVTTPTKTLKITATREDDSVLSTSVDIEGLSSSTNNDVEVLDYDDASLNTVTLSGDASTYYITLTKNTEFIFPSVLANKTVQFTLIIDNPNGTYTATYPSSVQSVNASNSTNITGDEILRFLGVNVNNTVKWYMSV